MENHPLVTIAVCTYKRETMMEKCLRSLIAQETDFRYDIVVVENDAAQGARAMIESMIPSAAEKGVEIRYYCETQPSISLSRNRCVAECRGEFLAFIDDDEWAAPDWLAKLVEVQRETGADVVSGCAEPIYAEGYPEYLKGMLLWYRGNFREKQEITQTATNSVLLRKTALELRTPFFNPAYTRSSDTEMSFFLRSHGIKMVKTHQAMVYETQPLSRGRMTYYWGRAFREANVIAGLHREYYYRMNGFRVNARLFMGSLWEMLKTLPMLVIRPRRAFFWLVFQTCRAAGIAAWYLGAKGGGGVIKREKTK